MINDPFLVVIGSSAGGGKALGRILTRLPSDYAAPILIVQHLHSTDNGEFTENLGLKIRLSVIVPCDKQEIEAGNIYVAPSNYHMLVERAGSIALSLDEKVKWSRPSIDVLFESAAHAFYDRVIAVLLTGANDDGAKGMGMIRSLGGLTIAQDPGTAEYKEMPQAAISAGAAQKVLSLENIADLLVELWMKPYRNKQFTGVNDEYLDARRSNQGIDDDTGVTND